MADEDFTTYTEVDEDGDVVVDSAVKVTWTTMRRDAETYLDKDYGAAHFGDFVATFAITVTDVEAGDATSASILGLCALSNAIGVMDDLNDVDLLAVNMQQNQATDDQYGFYIRQYDGGVSQFIEGSTLNFHTTAEGTIYLTFSRSGATVSLSVYSDADRTNLLYLYTTAVASLDTYRYIHAFSNWGRDVDPANHQSGYLENLDIGEPGPVVGAPMGSVVNKMMMLLVEADDD